MLVLLRGWCPPSLRQANKPADATYQASSASTEASAHPHGGLQASSASTDEPVPGPGRTQRMSSASTDASAAPQAPTEGAAAALEAIAALAQAARALRRFWKSVRAADYSPSDINAHIRLARSLAEQLETTHRTTVSKRWRDWVSTSIREGGSKLFKWLK